MDKKELATILNKKKIPAFRYFPSIGSTNDEAKDWLLEDAPEYAIVIADNQTAGRGRQGRTWFTTSGSSIALSIIIHPSKEEQKKIGLFSLATGLAVARTISTFCDGNVQVKWPNDVLIEGKKAAGILTESVWENNQLIGLVIGIGINVLNKAIPHGGSLRFPATCMQKHTNTRLERIKIIDHLIDTLINFRPLINNENFSSLFMVKMAFIDQNISLLLSEDRIISGNLKGIDCEGNLLLISGDNQLQTFPVGDISLRNA